jgi:hypothetical protein
MAQKRVTVPRVTVPCAITPLFTPSEHRDARSLGDGYSDDNNALFGRLKGVSRGSSAQPPPRQEQHVAAQDILLDGEVAGKAFAHRRCLFGLSNLAPLVKVRQDAVAG